MFVSDTAVTAVILNTTIIGLQLVVTRAQSSIGSLMIRHPIIKAIPPICIVCVDVWTLEHFNVERWIILWNVSPITQLYNPIRYCFMRLVWHKMIHENSFKINLGYIFSHQCGNNFQGEPKSDGLLKFGRNENSASESCLLNTKCINFDGLIVSVS